MNDEPLIRELAEACKRGRALLQEADGIPMRGAATLRRSVRGLEAIETQVVDWPILLPKLTRAPGFWDRLLGAVDSLRDDELVEACVGFAFSDRGARAQALWQGVLAPLVQRYGRVRKDWEFDHDLAGRLVTEWRTAELSTVVWHRTLVPLHNVRGPEEAIHIEPDLQIRPFTDQDRKLLFEAFAGTASPLVPSTTELDTWSHAIDVRWAMPKANPRTYDGADEIIRDLLRSIRLHNPGIAGTTIAWTRVDPPDAPYGRSWEQQRLSAPKLGASFDQPHKSLLSAVSGEDLARLLAQLRRTRNDAALQLALRRFDQAYERDQADDSLIDLWIAFEALFLADGNQELSYRAALRIARIVGHDAASRREAFDIARRSYTVRSALVHGQTEPSDISQVLQQTRRLAHIALRRWVLDPPVGGLTTIDHEIVG